VFKAGETAEAIYFILEGNVLILSPDETLAIANLGKNEVFGEMSILQGNIGVRSVMLQRL